MVPLYAWLLSFWSGTQYVTQEHVLKLGKYQRLVCNVKNWVPTFFHPVIGWVIGTLFIEGVVHSIFLLNKSQWSANYNYVNNTACILGDSMYIIYLTYNFDAQRFVSILLHFLRFFVLEVNNSFFFISNVPNICLYLFNVHCIFYHHQILTTA